MDRVINESYDEWDGQIVTFKLVEHKKLFIRDYRVVVEGHRAEYHPRLRQFLLVLQSLYSYSTKVIYKKLYTNKIIILNYNNHD